MCLPHRYVAMSTALTIENTALLLLRAFASGGNMFTEPLPGNELFRLSGVITVILIEQFWEELAVYLPLIQNTRHRKRSAQFFYCCVCIRCRRNMFTKLLPSNDGGIYIQTHKTPLVRLPGNWRDTQTSTQQVDLISLFLFFQNKESRLKKNSSVHWNVKSVLSQRSGSHIALSDGYNRGLVPFKNPTVTINHWLYYKYKLQFWN
jgi:hypothetical protein